MPFRAGRRVAYGDGVSRLDGLGGQLAAWAAAPVRPGRAPGRPGIRPVDVAAAIVVIAAVELNSVVATGPGQRPLNALSYAFGAVVAVPVLVRHRWPREALVGCSLLLLLFYSTDRRNISPAPLLCLPLYDAAAAGALVLAIVVPVFYLGVGFFLVGATTHQSLASLTSDFLPSVVVLLLAVLLGDTVRSRRELAAETAQRLRLAAEERDAEGGRRVAEERLRIARELHDTVAHSMATIAVQAAAALQVLGDGETGPRDALRAIRETSKGALADIRITLGGLRAGDGAGAAADAGAGAGAGWVAAAGAGASPGAAGLGRLGALTDAVRAAGAPVTVAIEGAVTPLPAAVDHCAYRILQESLTNVLRHAGAAASAGIVLRYGPGVLDIEVTDDGAGVVAGDAAAGDAGGTRAGGAGSEAAGSKAGGSGAGGSGAGGPGGGHGLIGMTERVSALSGTLRARRRPGGGFEVIARLPIPAAEAAARATETR
jgi:signal transduction histidine kinase